MVNSIYNSLSFDQYKILNYKNGAVVVKACPGSGKTYSVAARISKLLNENKFERKGIAALSFTNVACEEILDKLKDNFGIISLRTHPHFLGTIDRFINNFIFLPFGHLIMKCGKRPELVGEPHSPWNKSKGDKRFIITKGILRCVSVNPDSYFDCVTFDINNILIPIVAEREFHFSFKKYFKLDGNPVKNIQDIIDSKWRFFREGYANQSDANYIALRVLEEYPMIAENIANQFEYFMVDESQDTDEIQMKIIDILYEKGAKNIMLVGDRDQAIFEWHTAKPELFDNKYNQWEKIELIENRRSSQNICNFIRHLSSFSRIQAVDETVKNYEFKPEIHGFSWPSKSKGKAVSNEESKTSFIPIITHFLANCEQNGISIDKNSVAVLYRGRVNAQYIDVKRDFYEFDKLPWVKGNYHVKDIVRGLFLYENALFNDGYRLIEKGFLEAANKTNNPGFQCRNEYIQQMIAKDGFTNHRSNVFNFANLLPTTKGKNLKQWVKESNSNLHERKIPIQLNVNVANSDVLIEDLFGGDLNSKDLHPFYYGTIHSAKGKTFDSVLLILGKKPGNKSNYSTMLTNGPKADEKEELRNVYVAISRPRKILMMAVPKEDVSIWKSKFQV